MSKRYIFPQQHGERKKAKLDVTISDHNFPLSQNPGQGADPDNWGDDNDDEILLLASQACEQAYNNDISSLPDYSICMQPQSTSSQMFDPGPSTSRSGFTFKKPSTALPYSISTNLKNKCSTISSPLPGMSMKVMSKIPEPVNITDDIIFNDKVLGQDSDLLYRQLLQMQEENAKLKSENGKLLEKCVTKEGEASILRTQLKTCQVSVDNARLEKIKAQEKVQMEWTEKLSVANMQLHDLRTQLDFKNLEIISIKEKCKKLENSKIRLTQVTVGHNDISTSHRNNNSITPNDSILQHSRRVKTTTSAVQTTGITEQFITLNKSCTLDATDLTDVLPLILEPTGQHHNLLDYNEKLQKHTDSQSKCRVYSTFHRLPSTPSNGKEVGRNKVILASLYEDLIHIAANKPFEDLVDKYCNVMKAVKSVLLEVQSELETVSQRATTAFQKDMDEKYIDATATYLVVDKRDLLMGRSLYKDEQALLARRLVAILAFLLRNSCAMKLFIDIQKDSSTTNNRQYQILEVVQKICSLLDGTSCATLYSGLLLSTTSLIQNLHSSLTDLKLNVIRAIISSRAMAFVACAVLRVWREVPDVQRTLCPGSSVGNLKLDYEQGVLLFKKDSCYFQVLLKQIEAALKCMEKQNIIRSTVDVTQNLIAIYSNTDVEHSEVNVEQKQNKCDCQLVLIQVIVYALRICAVLLKRNQSIDNKDPNQQLLGICRSGIQLLYRCVLRDVEFGSQLGHDEGHLIQFCELIKGYSHNELYGNMLSEISGTFQPSPDDSPASHHRLAWINSFRDFSIVD